MANEAVKVEGPYEVHDFTVSTSVTISAATLCTLTTPRTAAASGVATAQTDQFAGIMATEHTAGKGKVEAGLYTKGIFELTAAPGAAIVDGDLVTLSGANTIFEAVAANILTGGIVGKAMEDIAGDATGEVHVGETV